MTVSTFVGPIFTRSNKSVTELLVVVQIVLSHKPFSAIAKYKRHANRSWVPFHCAIWFTFFDLFFLTKLSVAKLTILDFVIAFSNLLWSPLHSLMISFAFSLAYHWQKIMISCRWRLPSCFNVEQYIFIDGSIERIEWNYKYSLSHEHPISLWWETPPYCSFHHHLDQDQQYLIPC